ncbi:MAG TPA: IS481 family transposase, partial [Ramlibacter sp.]|nr:IS481 family transposase [Ramlibacter sp.]
MNTHKNARLTFARRLEMVHQMIDQQLTAAAAAAAVGVSEPTARKWLGRFLAGGAEDLVDASSKPHRSPRTISAAKALSIVELRRRRCTQARIAVEIGVSKSTVGRVLARAGLSKLRDLEPAEPVQRYEHAAPGELLHIDIKKLGRINRPGHRVTGDRTSRSDAGWEFLFVAVDDHARIAFTAVYADDTKHSATQFLQNAHAYYASLGVNIQRLLTDNGAVFRSKLFQHACAERGIRQKFTRPYRPQTNGKAE